MTRGKVLVVDDNAATRKLFRITLEGDDYEVVEADTGQAALHVLAAESVGIVLLDCRLPDTTGPEVARRISAEAPSLPIVAVTGWAHADEATMLTAGFVEVLFKPVAPSRLVEVVEQYLRQPPEALRGKGRTVLLLDDDPTQRKLMQLALATAGFEVIPTEGGEEAIELARKRGPDAVLSDVLMPTMDGFEVCRAFRNDPKLADIPVVLMSAHYVEEEDRKLGARFGASRYVSRSGGLDAVIREVVSALESRGSRATAEPPWELRDQHLRRVAHQLERQAALTKSFAHRASLQATAISILGSISEALSRQMDPESVLAETLSHVLDAAGLSVGAILLFGDQHRLFLRAEVGGVSQGVWSAYSGLFEKALDFGRLLLPSAEAGEPGEALLREAGIPTALVVPIAARDEAFGVLVLGSTHDDFSGAEGESFLHAVRSVSIQLGQALVIRRLFSRLTAAEERYRALFDNARDAIAVLNPAGVVLEINRRCEEIMGVARTELVGKHIAEFSPEGYVSSNVSTYEATVARGGGSIPPTPIQRSDGSIVHLEFSNTVVDVGGQTLVLAIGRDVSERLKLADQLRHAQKLEAVGRLAGGVAHDMNNVLGVVFTYADFLESSMSANDARKEDAAEIRRAAERGAALTRQLLAFSRQQIVQPKVLDVNELIRNLAKMIQTLIGEDVRFETSLADGLPNILADPGLIEQVVMNLAVNSRDAMPTGGHLKIVTSADRGRVLLDVMDTGTGMDSNTLQHMFEPFFTTKALGKGTGLGLATVFGIVKQSGGDIAVDSAVGRGTTFRISLPSVADTRAIARAPVAERDLRSSNGSETVVIVEDEAPLRYALIRALRDRGYRVLSEATGPATLDACAAHEGPIHLLVTDVVLPALNGPEIARRLRDRHPNLRVLFVSGYTDTAAYPEVPVGGRWFLQKPFTPQTLATRVREALDAAE